MSNKKLFLFSFVSFLLVMAGMLWTEQQAGCGKVIIPLELEPSIAAFKQRIAACDITWLATNTQLDFLFLIAYSATLFFALRGLSDKLSPLAWLTFLPGVFDSIENVLLLKFLYADQAEISAGVYSIYYWCVRIKFGILIIILLTLLVLVGQWIYKKAKGEKSM
ncbi:MAG TPA: hypothetical protein VK174_11095 [Chitinophagales bacterium]|nr:hypothetical protein [Chitinophagales bacterium]